MIHQGVTASQASYPIRLSQAGSTSDWAYEASFVIQVITICARTAGIVDQSKSISTGNADSIILAIAIGHIGLVIKHHRNVSNPSVILQKGYPYIGRIFGMIKNEELSGDELEA